MPPHSFSDAKSGACTAKALNRLHHRMGRASPLYRTTELYLSLLEEQLGLAITSEGWGAGELRAR